MLNQNESDRLWDFLEEQGAKDQFVINKRYLFSTNVQGKIRTEMFQVWIKLKNGQRKRRRIYYRMVRDATGTVLYDQLEDEYSSNIVPDIAVSPDRSDKLFSQALKLQEEIDRRIDESAEVY